MKNRWVRLTRDGVTCFGQIEDAGPGEYSDAEYVFGGSDARPRNTRYNGAGMDVEPAQPLRPPRPHRPRAGRHLGTGPPT